MGDANSFACQIILSELPPARDTALKRGDQVVQQKDGQVRSKRQAGPEQDVRIHGAAADLGQKETRQATATE